MIGNNFPDKWIRILSEFLRKEKLKMSTLTNLVVAFRCDDHKHVADLAIEYQSREAREDRPVECMKYLRDLGARGGGDSASGGGMSLWGIVGKTIDAESFVESLSGFWAELLARHYPGGPTYFDRVIVTFEYEGDYEAQAYEIGFSDEAIEAIRDLFRDKNSLSDPSFSRKLPPINMSHFRLPFAWVRL